MTHCQYIRKIKGSENAIVMIHGILGTPHHFDYLLEYIPADWSVYAILLDGHGSDVQAFSKTSMKKWERQVESTFDKVAKEHRNVYASAHSMGTLLTIGYANSHPCTIKKVFFMAIPLRACLRPPIFENALRVKYQKRKKNDPVCDATFCACSIDHNGAHLWEYIGWIPRFWELLVKIEKTRKILPKLRIKGVTFQSGKDEMVWPGSYRFIKGHPTLKAHLLKDSYHFYYADCDKNLGIQPIYSHKCAPLWSILQAQKVASQTGSFFFLF